MIRINLLSEGRRPVAAKEAKGPRFDLGGLDLGTMLLVGVLALALLFALAQNFLLARKVKATQQEVTTAQAEVARLEPIIREVEQFKAKKAELERKVQVITDLRANQQGPVRLMDKVSRSVPELLWLSRMNVQGTSVAIEGEAFNPNAIAHFIENLERVPEFHEPDTGAVDKKNEIYTFKVNFSFAPAAVGIDEAETPAVASAS